MTSNVFRFVRKRKKINTFYGVVTNFKQFTKFTFSFSPRHPLSFPRHMHGPVIAVEREKDERNKTRVSPLDFFNKGFFVARGETFFVYWGHSSLSQVRISFNVRTTCSLLPLNYNHLGFSVLSFRRFYRASDKN